MEIDYSKLEELFKVFGLSLEIKNGKAYFREIGSERLLNTYDPHSLLLKRDVDFLFHNYNINSQKPQQFRHKSRKLHVYSSNPKPHNIITQSIKQQKPTKMYNITAKKYLLITTIML